MSSGAVLKLGLGVALAVACGLNVASSAQEPSPLFELSRRPTSTMSNPYRMIETGHAGGAGADVAQRTDRARLHRDQRVPGRHVERSEGTVGMATVSPTTPSTSCVRVAAPADIDALKATAPACARAWRGTQRRAFTWYLRSGYRASGFEHRQAPADSHYLVTRAPQSAGGSPDAPAAQGR